jgi:hypothetical protein
MHLVKKRPFTILSITVGVFILLVEKIGTVFLLAPRDKLYIDIVFAVLLICAGILLDSYLHKLAKEKAIEKSLRQTNEQLSKANKALKESLAKIKLLSGLLPICASCKKVRNDKGYWEQIDAYFSEHSEARMAHWICPDCVNEIWHKTHKKDGTVRNR